MMCEKKFSSVKYVNTCFLYYILSVAHLGGLLDCHDRPVCPASNQH